VDHALFSLWIWFGTGRRDWFYHCADRSLYRLIPAASLVTGTALCLSSTAIVVEVLSKQKRLAKGAGRVSFAVLLFQDLAIVPILFMVSVMGKQGEGSVFYGILLAFLQTSLVLGLIVGVGRLALRPLFRLVAATQSPELFMSATLFVVIATGIAAASVGLSMAVGAFVAGLLLAETEFRREVSVTIEPFKGLMLGVFFMSVGMGIDPAIITRDPALIIGLAAGLIALKVVIVLGLSQAFRNAPSCGLGVGVAARSGGRVCVCGVQYGGEFQNLAARASGYCSGGRIVNHDHDSLPGTIGAVGR
jgi:monovalent cation:H+ antiporter-2, CPA2 family